MDATRLILKTLHHDGGHVLIHCSDGWDRTAQLSALAQLCLDPYFRTVRGFMVLVEKGRKWWDCVFACLHNIHSYIPPEWTGFGHKLNDRCGFLAVHPPKITSSSKSTSSLASASSVIATSGSSPFLGAVGLPSSITSHSSSSSSSAQRSSKEEKETAPVFLQFLECAQLIIRAYPDHFEFGEKMLVDLYAALQSCQFGTFLMNCEREREEKRIRERCQSYWSYVLQQPRAYVNPLYRGGAGGTGNVPPPLWPHVEPKHIRYWVGMHSRYDPPVLVAGALSLRSAAVQESPIGDGEDALDSDDFAAHYQPYSRLRPAVSRFYPYANHGDQEAYVENLAETLEACRSAAIYWRAKQIGKTITPVNDECKLRVARSTTTGHGWCIGAVTVDAHHLTWIKPGACQQCSALSSPLDRLNPCWSCGAIICTDCALASDGVAMWGGATKYRVCNKCTGERNANTTITE